MGTPLELAVETLQRSIWKMEGRLGAMEARLAKMESRLGVTPANHALESQPASGEVSQQGMADAPYELDVTERRAAEHQVPAAAMPAAPAQVPAEQDEANVFALAPAPSVARPATHAEAHPQAPAPPHAPPLPPQGHAAAVPGAKAAHFAAQHVQPARPGQHGSRPMQMGAKPREESLENRIGKTVASWVGAIVVLLGILLFLKFAWDQGWLRLSPAARIGLAMFAGAAMVGIGEWLHIKAMRPLSAAVAGAGLAVLMASLFAGNVVFADPVISRGLAFAGVIAVGALGIGLALHMRAQTLAVLSMFGMYVSPFILSSGEDRSLALFTYLFVVTASGLTVSFLKEGWPAVRVIAFIGGWLWLLIWTAVGPFVMANRELGIAAIAGFFGIYLAEMAGNLLRAMKGNPAEGVPETRAVIDMEASVSLLSFFNTALAMSIAGILFVRTTGIGGLWAVALGLSGVMGMLAFVTPSKKFSVSAGIQAMALLVLAVPLYFDRLAITGAWAILAMALAVYAYVTESKAARGWMFGLFCLVTFKVVTVDRLFNDSLTATLFSVGTQAVTGWMLLGWATTLYGVVLAWLSRGRFREREDGTFEMRGAPWATAACAIIASLTALYAATTLNYGNVFTLSMIAWVGLILGMIKLFQMERGPDVETVPGAVAREAAFGMQTLQLQILAIIGLVGLGVKWAIFDGVMLRVMASDISGPPLLSLYVVNGLLLMGEIVISRAFRQVQWEALTGWWIALIAFWMANVETIRAVDYWMQNTVNIAGVGNAWIIKNVALSILWGSTGFGAVVTGFVRKVPPIRWAGLGLLGVTVAKVLLVDMANVETMLRILSFMVTGGLLLVVSYIYHRVAKTMEGTAPDAAEQV